MNKYYEAAQAKGHYYHPTYKPGEPKPAYFPLFKWNLSHYDDVILIGSINRDMFDTTEKKISYIQGMLDDSSYPNSLSFANGKNICEMCIEFIDEIAGIYGGAGCLSVTHWLKTIPFCSTIEIDPETVNIIKGIKIE